MQKLTKTEFDSLLKILLVDALYPEYIHIPGLGIRMSYGSFVKFSEDLYKAYSAQGETGIALFLDNLKKRPDISIAVEKTKKLIYSHFDTIGIKDEMEKQKYVSGIVSSVEEKRTL